MTAGGSHSQLAPYELPLGMTDLEPVTQFVLVDFHTPCDVTTYSELLFFKKVPPELQSPTVADGESESPKPPQPLAWNTTMGYEQLLSIQQCQHALALQHKDAEVAHLRALLEHVECRDGRVHDDPHVQELLRTKDDEVSVLMSAKHKELELMAALLQLREQQIEELRQHCEAQRLEIARLRRRKSSHVRGSRGHEVMAHIFGTNVGAMPVDTPEASPKMADAQHAHRQRGRRAAEPNGTVRECSDGSTGLRLTERKQRPQRHHDGHALDERHHRGDSSRAKHNQDQRLHPHHMPPSPPLGQEVQPLSPSLSQSQPRPQPLSQTRSQSHSQLMPQAQPLKTPSGDETEQLRKEVRRLRLRLEELEAAMAEQHEQNGSIAWELEAKDQRVEALEAQVRRLKALPPEQRASGDASLPSASAVARKQLQECVGAGSAPPSVGVGSPWSMDNGGGSSLATLGPHDNIPAGVCNSAAGVVNGVSSNYHKDQSTSVASTSVGSRNSGSTGLQSCGGGGPDIGAPQRLAAGAGVAGVAPSGGATQHMGLLQRQPPQSHAQFNRSLGALSEPQLHRAVGSAASSPGVERDWSRVSQAASPSCRPLGRALVHDKSGSEFSGGLAPGTSPGVGLFRGGSPWPPSSPWRCGADGSDTTVPPRQQASQSQELLREIHRLRVQMSELERAAGAGSRERSARERVQGQPMDAMPRADVVASSPPRRCFAGGPCCNGSGGDAQLRPPMPPGSADRGGSTTDTPLGSSRTEWAGSSSRCALTQRSRPHVQPHQLQQGLYSSSPSGCRSSGQEPEIGTPAFEEPEETSSLHSHVSARVGSPERRFSMFPTSPNPRGDRLHQQLPGTEQQSSTRLREPVASPSAEFAGWEYRPHVSGDVLDATLAALLNQPGGRYRGWRALICRLDQGVYLCGTRRVQLRVTDAPVAATQASGLEHHGRIIEASEDGGKTWAELEALMQGAGAASQRALLERARDAVGLAT